jgi:hypothetical protein
MITFLIPPPGVLAAFRSRILDLGCWAEHLPSASCTCTRQQQEISIIFLSAFIQIDEGHSFTVEDFLTML